MRKATRHIIQIDSDYEHPGQTRSAPAGLLVSGSIRAGGYTALAVRLALKGAEELRCKIRFIDLRDYQLIFCDGKRRSKFVRR
jgi:hypothetical protein